MYFKNPTGKIKFHSRKVARINKQALSTQEEIEQSINSRRKVKFSALVCCGYCNELPQAWVLKTTKVYSLIVSLSRNLKSSSLGQHHGGSRATLFLEALGENPFPASSSFHAASSPQCLALWSRCPSFACQSFLCFSFLRMLVMASEAPLNTPGSSLSISRSST